MKIQHPLNPDYTDAEPSWNERWERIVKNTPRTKAAMKRIDDADRLHDAAGRIQSFLLARGHKLSDADALGAAAAAEG